VLARHAEDHHADSDQQEHREDDERDDAHVRLLLRGEGLDQHQEEYQAEADAGYCGTDDGDEVIKGWRKDAFHEVLNVEQWPM
jgi:hypothetical protein